MKYTVSVWSVLLLLGASNIFFAKNNVQLQTDADFNLIRAVEANDAEDVEIALLADGVHVNAYDEMSGNSAFAIAAHNFEKAAQAHKRAPKVQAEEILKLLLQHGAQPVKFYWAYVGRGMKKKPFTNVEIDIFIQKYGDKKYRKTI